MNNYNYNKDTCDVCGISKEEVLKKHRGGSTYQDRMAASFLLGHNGEVWCPSCHKEKELKALFDLMERREKEAKRKKRNG